MSFLGNRDMEIGKYGNAIYTWIKMKLITCLVIWGDGIVMEILLIYIDKINLLCLLINLYWQNSLFVCYWWVRYWITLVAIGYPSIFVSSVNYWMEWDHVDLRSWHSLIWSCYFELLTTYSCLCLLVVWTMQMTLSSAEIGVGDVLIEYCE